MNVLTDLLMGLYIDPDKYRRLTWSCLPHAEHMSESQTRRMSEVHMGESQTWSPTSVV